jgi:biotin carboxyl carrier protein
VKTEVISPTAGTLSYQYMESGAEVSEGEAICEVEVMKMQNSLIAPISGIVTFLIALGEVVAEGDVVAVIEGE